MKVNRFFCNSGAYSRRYTKENKSRSASCKKSISEKHFFGITTPLPAQFLVSIQTQRIDGASIAFSLSIQSSRSHGNCIRCVYFLLLSRSGSGWLICVYLASLEDKEACTGTLLFIWKGHGCLKEQTRKRM